MQDIYLWMIFSLLLGGIGFFVAFSKAMRERKRVLDSIPEDIDESVTDDVMEEDERSPREQLSGMTFVYTVIPAPAFIYVMLGAVLVGIFGVNSDVQARVATAGLILLGLGSFFTNIGRSQIYGDIMDGVNRWGEGSLKDFGRYTVILTMFETLAIYAMLLFELGLVFSGILEGEVYSSLSMQSANMYMYGVLILGISCAASFSMAWGFDKIDGPINEDGQKFSKKMIYMAIGHIPAIIGLIASILLLLFSGLMG